MKFSGEKRLTELRKCLGETVKKIWEDKEPVLIKSHEKPIAAIVPLHMLDMIKEQREVRADQALNEFTAADTKVSSNFSFDDLEGHEEPHTSPEIEIDMFKMKDEMAREDSAKYYRDKCAKLQAELNLLKRQINTETTVIGHTVQVHQVGESRHKRFVERLAMKNPKPMVKIDTNTGNVSVVSPVLAQKLPK